MGESLAGYEAFSSHGWCGMGMSQAQQPLDWEWDYNVKSAKYMMNRRMWNVFICD